MAGQRRGRKIVMAERGVGKKIKDLLFPYFCADCGKEGEWWCKNCLEKEQNCAKIKAESGLNAVSALFNYEEHSPVGYLIKQFKYNYVKDISALWQNIMVEKSVQFEKNAVLVPVPLYPKRERERGYNQAEIICELIAGVTGLKVLSGKLLRVRHTKQQAKLDRQERAENVKGAFVWVGDLPSGSVVLVDDVYTTGATMKECTVVLNRAGIQNVSGFVLAHG